MREEQKRQFFSMKGKEPTTAKIGGKFGFNSLPNHVKESIKKRLSEKDEVMAQGLKGIFPGIKIDGKQVTRENIHEFEIPAEGTIVKEESKATKKLEEKVESKSKYVKEDLEKLSFSKLKKIAEKLGETGRSKLGLIKDILKHN